jgi:hypothetical protein
MPTILGVGGSLGLPIIKLFLINIHVFSIPTALSARVL